MAEQGPLTGQRLGDKFVLGELLGQGGFGAVYKAQHLLLNRPQAIKVLLEQHFGSPKFRERFIREAQTLAALDHANILPVHDFGVEGNRAYLVMPFISGGTLQGVLKARPGPMSLDETARYLTQICAALDYAHKRGVVHLDLKPLNLLMHEDGRLLLSDFGLAHLMEQGAVEGGTSLQFGSPLYMAPEHFDGRPEQRSDLYALGIILYQLLAGRVPFDGTSPMALMRQHLTEAPPLLRAARPDLPPALDAVLGKALAKQPAQRYQSAGELLYEFQAAVAGRLSQPLGGGSSLLNAQTRVSQPLLPETVRAVNPPISTINGGWAGSSPQTPRLPSQPVAYPSSWQYAPTAATPSTSGGLTVRPPDLATSQKMRIWTPGFTQFFWLAGAGALLLAIIGNGTTLGDQMDLLLQFSLAATALAGIFFVKSWLLRAGLLAQLVAMVIEGITSIFTLQLDTAPDPNFALRLILIYLPAAASALLLVSLVLLSYGIASWKMPQDIGISALQVFLTGGLVLFVIEITRLPYAGYVYYVPLACASLAFFVLVLRPVGWKQHLALIGCLTAGAFFFVAHTALGYGFIESFSDSYFSPPYTPLSELHSHATLFFGLYSLSYVPTILGILLLIQTERVRQKAQKQPALAQQP